MEPLRFITVFTTARYFYLSWGKSVQSRPSLYFFTIHFNITFPSALSLPSDVFHSKFSNQSHIHSCPPYMLRALPVSFFLILSPKERVVRSLNHEATHCVFFSSPLLLPLRPKCLSQHPILEHPQPTFLHQYEKQSFTHV
jgi:hypothetical protein